MPRLPVDGKKVIEHRITFGTKEREIIESLSTSYAIKSVFPSFATILTDATALYAIGVLIEIIFKVDLPYIYTTDDAQQLWQSLKESFKTLEVDREMREGSIVGGIAGLWDQISYVLSGGLNDKFVQDLERKRRDV
jgi:hypothetical protein